MSSKDQFNRIARVSGTGLSAPLPKPPTLTGRGEGRNLDRQEAVAFDGEMRKWIEHVQNVLEKVEEANRARQQVEGISHDIDSIRAEVESLLTQISGLRSVDSEFSEQITLLEQQVEYILQLVDALGDKFHEHIQSTPSDVWHVHHKMNRRVGIMVYDSGNRQIIGEVEHVSNDYSRLHFNAVLTGTAIAF